MINAVWTYILAAWTLRNNHLHHDAGRLSLPNYHQAVRTMYETQNQLPTEIRTAVFQQPLALMLEKSPQALRLWIERSQQYIKQQLHAAKKRNKLNTHDIHSFFQCLRPQANDLHPP